MKNNRNNYIGKMRKGFKQKLSLLMIACLLFTGFHGLTISGRAETPQKEQNNEIEVNGSQVKVQLLGEDLRRAATEAILKGEKLEKSNLLSYSKDQDLATEFEEYFDGEKEIYPIPLNSISENLEESLAEEEAGLQIYVERDAKNLERLVRQESKESLLLYSKESAVAKLLPRAEEKTSVEKEEKASDSELIRDTELTGSELITFVYENKSEQKMTFQLSVDGNRYPKVSVAPKASLFKQFLGDAKKAQAEAKNNEGKEEKKEQASVSATEESKVEEKEAVAELKASEEAKKEESKEVSDVELVSTAAEEHKEETQSVEAKEEKPESTEEKKEETVAESEAEKAGAPAESTQAEEKQSESKAKESKTEDKSLLKEITENSEEFFPELQSVRFTQYSLNELGRKSQNVEIEGFGNVQVFYEEAAFEDKDVVLEAKRLFKRDEEVEGEKLTEEQENILKEKSLYEDSMSLDIRFVDKKDIAQEVEPVLPVSVRITIEKKALPEEAKPENISIHHIVEEKGDEAITYLETVSRSDKEKKLEKQEALKEKFDEQKVSLEDEVKADSIESTDVISKEFIVNSFSTYVVHWKENADQKQALRVRFHYVDEAFNEIAPTKFAYENILTSDESKKEDLFNWTGEEGQGFKRLAKANELGLYKDPYGYVISGVYGLAEEAAWDSPYVSKQSGYKVLDFTTYDFELGWSGGSKRYAFKDCAYHDFFFVYKSCIFPGKPDEDVAPLVKNDKYITKLGEEEYELTLTGQVDRQKEKEKALDILFVYDNTGNISEEEAKVTKNNIKDLIDKISDLPKSYDPRFALITMDGDPAPQITGDVIEYNVNREKKKVIIDGKVVEIKAPYEDRVVITEEAIQGFKIGGSIGNLRGTNLESPETFKIEDSKFNDSRNNYAFTSDAQKIKEKIDSLQSSGDNSTGANYYAAIRNAKSLMQINADERVDGSTEVRYGKFDNENNFDSRNPVKQNLARKDSRKIIIFIAGGDATRTYIKEGKGGVYEDYIKKDDLYYLTRTKYEEGQSIGNGKTIYYPALNDARAEIRSFKDIDEFYSVGIGDKKNWKHLNELAMGQYRDDKDISVLKDEEKDKLNYARPRVLPGRIKYKLYEGGSSSAIKNIFADLRNKIECAQVQNIVIEDTLSQYVELLDGTNSFEGKLYKKSAQGPLKDIEIERTSWASLGLKDIKVEPTKKVAGKIRTITLKTDPENFVLRPGYEIRLVIKVKPTGVAYNHIAYPNMRKIGEDRTDLNKIYSDDGFKKLDNDGKPLDLEKYGTSVGQYGLYTNDKATISYSYKDPKDSSIKPQKPKEYKKPIINVKPKNTGYLKVYKGFVGFGYNLYDEQKQQWTELGKHVLKKVEFDVIRKLPNGRGELITTVNLGDDRWISGPIDSTKSFALKNGYVLKIHPVETIDEKTGKPYIIRSVKDDNKFEGEGYRFCFEVDNVPKNVEYKVVERVKDKEKEYNLGSFIYKYKDSDDRIKSNKTEEYNTMPASEKNPHGNVYAFNNFYEVTEKPNVDLKVKKVVKKLGFGPLTEEEEKRKFDFYLALYHEVNENGINIRKPYKEHELEEVVKGFNKGLIPSEVKVVYVENIQRELNGSVAPNAPDPDHYAIHFQLQQGQTANFSLKEGIKYRVYEKQDADYDTPLITRLEDGKTIEDSCDVFGNNHVWYTCTDYKKNVGELITYYNYKKLPIPTGLVRDISPYILSIFSFITMAGAYFAINKKRREA